MPIYIDMMDFLVEVDEQPKRVISLVPSLSLLLHDMGLGQRLVGITKFCVHPEKMKADKTIVGGTKLLNHDVIQKLKPDLIIANKEENNQADIELLQEEFPVWISDINNVEQSLEAITMLGEIVKCQEAAKQIHEDIVEQRLRFQTLKPKERQRIAYVIWNNPFMAAGSNTFIDEMLSEGGWSNAFAGQTRYPAFTIEGLKAMKPDWIFLSTEPFPFKEKHKALFRDVLSPERVLIVDGEMFSWYGSRLRDSYSYFTTLHSSMKTSAL